MDGNTPQSAHAPGTLILKPYANMPQASPAPTPASPADAGVGLSRPLHPTPGRPTAPGRIKLPATATFRSFQAWVDLQRRLTAMAPMVGVDIRSINANSAEITLDYSSSLEALRTANWPRAAWPPSEAPGRRRAGYSLQLAN